MKKRASFLLIALTILFSIFMMQGAVATDITGCGTLSSSGTYNLVSPITDDATNPCISITSSDVILDCINNTNWIDGNSGFGTAGISIDGSATPYNNITIRNCNITDWETDISASYITNSTFQNINAKRISSSGNTISISHSINILLDSIDFVVGGSARGILFDNVTYSKIENSEGTGFDGSAGFGIIRLEGNSSYNNITNIFITQSLSIVIYDGNFNKLENITVQEAKGRGGLSIVGNYNNISFIKIISPSFIGGFEGNGLDIQGNNNNFSYLNISDYDTTFGAIGITGSNNSITKSYFRNNSFAILFNGDYADYNNSIYDNIFSENSTTIIGNGVRNYTQHFNTTKILGTNIIGGSYLGGNAWFGLNGTDADGDGFFDSPYIINETSMIDYLPLNLTIIVPVTNQLPYLILSLSQISQNYGCVKPNTPLIIMPNAYDVENDTIYISHRCFIGDNLSAFTTNWTKICIYSSIGDYNISISANDTANGIDYRTAYYPRLITVSEEDCICGYNNNGICFNRQIVNPNDINKGILPNIYFGMVGFLNSSFSPIAILIYALLFIALVGAIFGLMGKLLFLGRR